MPGFELFGDDEKNAIVRLFEANNGVLSSHGFEGMRNGVFLVREFEQAFSKRLEVPYCQAVTSGTAALKVALKAMGVKSGDEVIIPSFTFVATAEAVIETGATPVIVDIDKSLNMCPKSFENAVTDKTRAVIPVHMMGNQARLDEILAVAKTNDIMVLEDNAQGCGGTYKGKLLGTMGTMGTFSFDPGKTITTGEGGMVVTRDEDLYIRARSYHDHGHEYSKTEGRAFEKALLTGFNYRMNEIGGALGLTQLSKLDYILEKQRKNKAALMNTFKDLPYEFREIVDPEGELGDAIIFFLDTPALARAFSQKMRENGLGSKNIPDAMKWHFSRYWGHMFEEYNIYMDCDDSTWGQSGELLERAIALPVLVNLSDLELEEIAEKISKISRCL